MPQDTILAKFSCSRCGAETYSLMDDFGHETSQVIACWQCHGFVSVTHAGKVWTGSTPQEARRKRLRRLHLAAVARAS